MKIEQDDSLRCLYVEAYLRCYHAFMSPHDCLHRRGARGITSARALVAPAGRGIATALALVASGVVALALTAAAPARPAPIRTLLAPRPPPSGPRTVC